MSENDDINSGVDSNEDIQKNTQESTQSTLSELEKQGAIEKVLAENLDEEKNLSSISSNVDSGEEVGKSIDEINSTDKKQPLSPEKYKKRKKKILFFLKLSLLIILFVGSAIVVIPLAQSLGGGDTVALSQMFETMNWDFAIYALLCLVVLILIGCVRMCYITYITSKKFLPFTASRIFLLGKFYDLITPLATGGQPFEIYELNRQGIPGGVATAIPLIRYFVQIFTLAPIALIFFIINSSVLSSVEPTLATLITVSAYIGLIVFLIIPTFLITVSVAPKFGRRIAHGVIKIGCKLKLVRNYDKAVLRAEKMVDDFKYSLKYVVSKPLHLIFIIIITLIETFATYALPFFLCVALGDVSPSWTLLYQTFTLGLYAFFAVSFLPTPGNAGFSESVFAIAFAGVALGKNVIFWLVIFWRVFTYYIFIIIGLIVILIDIIRKRIGNKRKAV